MAKSEIDTVAEMIVRTHDGQMLYNLGDVCKIVGQGKNHISAYLHDSWLKILTYL